MCSCISIIQIHLKNNIETDFKIRIFKQNRQNPVEIRMVGQSVIQYNIIKRKENERLYSYKAFSRILQFSCVLSTFFS